MPECTWQRSYRASSPTGRGTRQQIRQDDDRVAVREVERRRDGRRQLAAMTGPARHDLATVEVRAIDVVDHRDHRARRLLPRGIVFPLRIRRAGAGVAVAAAQAQRGREDAHGPHELVDRNALEHLNVLEDLVGRQLPRGHARGAAAPRAGAAGAWAPRAGAPVRARPAACGHAAACRQRHCRARHDGPAGVTIWRIGRATGASSMRGDNRFRCARRKCDFVSHATVRAATVTVSRFDQNLINVLLAVPYE